MLAAVSANELVGLAAGVVAIVGGVGGIFAKYVAGKVDELKGKLAESRDDLDECLADRHDLRNRLELVLTSLLGLLPVDKRNALLQAVDSQTPPTVDEVNERRHQRKMAQER